MAYLLDPSFGLPTPGEAEFIESIEQTSKEASRACWWMKSVDRETAERLNVSEMMQTVIGLLQKVDNISMDIIIKIKEK